MKKLYMLLLMAAVCLLSQVAVAQVTVSTTNANNTTEKNNATWYVIRNVETGKFLKYVGSKFNMTLTEGTISDDGKTTAGLDSDNMFYFTGLNGSKDETDPLYIKNYSSGTSLVCAGPDKWNETGETFYINEKEQGDGKYYISHSGNAAASDALHYNPTTAKIDYFLGSDNNSLWEFIQIKDFATIMGLTQLIDDAWNAVDATEGWGNGFWSGITGGYYKENLKNGTGGLAGILYWGTSINERNHGSLSQTVNDITEANDILKKYKEGYQAIINFAEIQNYRDQSKYLSTNSTSLTVNGVQTTHTNVWKLVNVEGEFFSIYNEASNAYVAAPKSADGSNVGMVTDINKAGVWEVAIIDSKTEGSGENTTLVSATVYFRSVDLPDAYLCLTQEDKKVVKAVSGNSDEGTKWIITPVVDVEIKDDFYALAANMAWQYPYYLQENEGLVQDACIYYTSNAPAADGTTTCELIDGSYTTSYTTTENSISEPHYLQADMDGNSVTQFYFYIKANLQRADGRPIDISVYGSNDGNTFNKITDVKTMMTDEMFYFSDLIECTAYKHLRFEVNSVNVGDKAFTISEFYVLPYNKDVELCVTAIKGFYGTALYADEIKSYASNLVALEAKYYLDNNTTANGKVAKQGETPEVGQYRYDKYVALEESYISFKELEDSNDDAAKYQRGLLLADALYAFKNSKCSPMFIISSAWEDGYSADLAIECDEHTADFATAEANYWDMRQWFVNYSLQTTVMEPMNAAEIKSTIGKVLLMDAQHASAESVTDWETLYESAVEAYAVRLYNAPDYLAINEYEELSIVNVRPTTESNQNAAWYFTYVGTSAQVYDLDADNSEHMAFVESLASFGEIYRQAYEYYNNYDPTKTILGKYNYVEANSLTKNGFDGLFEEATKVFEKGPAKTAEEYLAGTSTELDDLITNLSAHFPNFHLNDPPTGYYYRLRGRLSRNYITSTIDGDTIVMGTMTDGNGDIIDDVAAKSILYAKAGEHDGDANILMFSTGRYLEHNGTGFQNANYPCLEYSLDDKYPHENDGYYSQSVFIHTSKTATNGYYALAFNDTHYLCDSVTKATGVANPTFSNKYDWAIEVVTELPLEISAANVTSLCVPVELKIPEGITAYILTGKEVADGNHLRVTDYEAFDKGTPVYNLMPIGCGIIPAGLPVIIKGTQGVHYFPINYNANDDTDSDGTTKSDELQEEIAGLRDANWLDGTHDARFISEADGYTHQILSKKNGEVGMYKVTTKSAAERGITYISTEKKLFINQSHRAWLCYPTATISASGYSFAIGGTGHDTTGIDEVIGESGKVKGIYDLQGRKIDNPTKGIYIIDGKKILIK